MSEGGQVSEHGSEAAGQAEAVGQETAARTARQAQGLRTRDFILPILAALAFTSWGWSSVQVNGSSMQPTLRHGERLAIDKRPSWLGGSYQRGDIVILRGPGDASFKIGPLTYRPFIVKRIVAIGGDRVQTRRGQLLVNDRPYMPQLREFWTGNECLDTDSKAANLAELTVPQGRVFLAGDNRSTKGSLDSRIFGTVKISQLAGRVSGYLFQKSRPVLSGMSCSALAGAQAEYSARREATPRIAR